VSRAFSAKFLLELEVFRNLDSTYS